MPALTAADWTVTVVERCILGYRRKHLVTLALAGTNTYPDNGIPLPTAAQFGFVRNLDSLHVYGVDQTAGTVSEYVYRLNKANNKLLLYSEEVVAAGGPLLEALATEVPGPRTLDVEAWGW